MKQLPNMNLDYLLVLLNEIDHVCQSEKNSLESSLKQLVENIFKLQYWELEQGRNYRHWQSMIVSSRSCIQKLLQYNPSLQKHLENIYPQLYQDAVHTWQVEFYIPKNIPIELEKILDQNYFG
jgi:hypothetical protein